MLPFIMLPVVPVVLAANLIPTLLPVIVLFFDGDVDPVTPKDTVLVAPNNGIFDGGIGGSHFDARVTGRRAGDFEAGAVPGLCRGFGA